MLTWSTAKAPTTAATCSGHSAATPSAVDPACLSAASLSAVDAERVEELFRIDRETIAGAQERARLWRNLAAGLNERYEGSTVVLLRAAQSRLGGSEGLIERLAQFEAFGDPLAKKAYLFAKIAARRGWLEVVDPECWAGLCGQRPDEARPALRSRATRAGR